MLAMRNLLTNPRRLPLIAPSILSADFANMAADCRAVLEAGADLLHVDVMDGHFVPNLTMGPDMVRGVRRAIPDAFLDVHLMVTDPWLYARPFADAGANHITFHVEVIPPSEIPKLAARIRELGVTVGLAINPPTPLEQITPHVDHFDMILVMSVNPGRSGQAFIPEVLAKTEAISDLLTPNQRLEMDGGLAPTTITSCLDAGCDVVVAGSAVFAHPAPKRPEVIRTLRGV